MAVPWQQMSRGRHSAAWHGGIIGVWPLKDSARLMTTPLSLSGRKGPLNSCVCGWVWVCTETFGCVCGVLLHHQKTLLHTEFLDAAGPGDLSSILPNFWLILALLKNIASPFPVIFHPSSRPHCGSGRTLLVKQVNT